MISVAFLRKFTFPLTLFLIFSFKTGVHLRRAWAVRFLRLRTGFQGGVILRPPWKTY